MPIGRLKYASMVKNIWEEITGNKTLALADAGKRFYITAAATITVPLNSAVAFETGEQIDFMCDTTGTVQFAATEGVTLKYKSGLKINGQYAWVTLIKQGTNTWALVGSLKA
jgi:hypothetical protein